MSSACTVFFVSQLSFVHTGVPSGHVAQVLSVDPFAFCLGCMFSGLLSSKTASLAIRVLCLLANWKDSNSSDASKAWRKVDGWLWITFSCISSLWRASINWSLGCWGRQVVSDALCFLLAQVGSHPNGIVCSSAAHDWAQLGELL